MIKVTSKTQEVLEALKGVKPEPEPIQTQTQTQTQEQIYDQGQCETHTTKMNDPEFVNKWINNPLFKKFQKHTLTTDTTAAISELSAGILTYGMAATVGRMLARVEYTSEELIKVRMPSEPVASKSARGWDIHSHGEKNDFLMLQPDQEITYKESWDQTYIEDSSWDVLQRQIGAGVYAVAKKETEEIIAVLKSLKSDTGNAGKISTTDEAEVTADVLIKLRGKIASKDRMVKAFVMNEDTFTNLLTSEDLKSSEYFQAIYDYEQGMQTMNATFLGARLLPTTLMPETEIYAVDSDAACVLALRRDNLITPFTDDANQKAGVTISNRYDVKKGRADGFAWYGD